MISDIPTINILDYIQDNTRSLKRKFHYEEDFKILDEILKNPITRDEFSNKYHKSSYYLNHILNKYEEQNPGIKSKVLEAMNEARRITTLRTALNKSLKLKGTNRYITEYKLKNNLNTRDFIKNLGIKVPVISMNLIIEGKAKPTPEIEEAVSKLLNIDKDIIFNKEV